MKLNLVEMITLSIIIDKGIDACENINNETKREIWTEEELSIARKVSDFCMECRGEMLIDEMPF